MKKAIRFTNYLKRNAVYLIIAFSVLAIGLSLTIFFIEKDTPDNSIKVDQPLTEQNPSIDDSEIVEELVISFIMPVEQVTSIVEYSDTMVFNETLGRYSSHRAIDFFAEEGTSVLAVYGGKIESIETALLSGVTVVIDHGDGLKTSYNSIEVDENELFVGKKVEAGEVIGTVSTTNRQEYKSGAHLHFQVTEDGEVIDPSKYLTLQEK